MISDCPECLAAFTNASRVAPTNARPVSGSSARSASPTITGLTATVCVSSTSPATARSSCASDESDAAPEENSQLRSSRS
ncbi:Uncharacterised protein [Mycobacteroides abscessus subsp. abscessus]|nr:Uncharacterised protein [Mycobacteroides abscessus subsp. abscessus]